MAAWQISAQEKSQTVISELQVKYALLSLKKITHNNLQVPDVVLLGEHS